jgi:hypothetical protein
MNFKLSFVIKLFKKEKKRKRNKTTISFNLIFFEGLYCMLMRNGRKCFNIKKLVKSIRKGRRGEVVVEEKRRAISRLKNKMY